MNKKTLLISSHSFAGVESYDWFQELPNISDYDVIILDTPRIFTFWFSAGRLAPLEKNEYVLSEPNQIDQKTQSNIFLLKEKLLEILEFDVIVYALYTRGSNIWRSDKVASLAPQLRIRGVATAETLQYYFINTNDWCPISIKTVAEKGKTILVKDEIYQEYFRDFKSWQYYFVPDSLRIEGFEHAYSSKWKVTPRLNTIATNKVDKPIAIEFVSQFHKWTGPELRAWRAMPYKKGGRLVLLPVVDIYNTEPHIELLLRQIKGLEQTPPPSWVSTVEIPGEASLKTEIAAEKRSLETLESRIRGLESSLGELQKYKGLLYETGLPLQELVRSNLEKLGASIKPSIVTDEFIITIGDREALVEVKGVGKSISKDDVGQLIVDKGEHIKATGQDIKGILIANAWRLLPLEQRNTRDKPIFPHNIAQIARNQDIGLISTIELFKAFCKALQEPQQQKEILNKIITGQGVVTF